MNSSNVMKPQVLYRTYSQRWVVLASVCLLALSNATQWIAFAPVHDAANLFYCNNLNNLSNNEIMKGVEGSSCDIETWSSQIFQLVGVITGLFGMFITDRYGIRVSCHFGAALNLCGSIIRFISSLPLLEKSCRLIFLFFGQTISAMSQPFFLCLSPKVAEYWFGENQRALANSLSFIANPFGVFLGSITPITFSFLFEKKQNDNLQQQTELLILYVNLLLMILSAFTMLFCLLVTRQKPPTPPSASSDFDKPEFFKGLCLLFNSKFFLIQTLTFGMAFALQWSIFFTASKQLLILGFDKTKVNSGYLLASSAFAGTLSTIFGGWIVDRTKKFNEFIKFSYVGIAVSAIALDTLLHNPSVFSSIPVILIATLFIFFILMGIFAIPVFPISLELGVESTFPIAEASSSGILVIAGQLQLFLLTFIMQSLESVGWIYGGKRNYKLAIDFWALTAVLGAVFAFLLLRPRYNRLEYEQNARILINKCNEIN